MALKDFRFNSWSIFSNIVVSYIEGLLLYTVYCYALKFILIKGRMKILFNFLFHHLYGCNLFRSQTKRNDRTCCIHNYFDIKMGIIIHYWLKSIQNLYVIQYLRCVEFCYKQKDAADPKMLVAQVIISTVYCVWHNYWKSCSGFFLGFAGESCILYKMLCM